MATRYAAPVPTDGGRPSRFTRALYAAVVVLATVALTVRLVHGVRTGRPDWLAMTAPAGVLLGLTAIMVGPRRRAAYFPLIVVSFALVVASFAIPRRRAAAPPAAPTAPPAPTGR